MQYGSERRVHKKLKEHSSGACIVMRGDRCIGGVGAIDTNQRGQEDVRLTWLSEVTLTPFQPRLSIKEGK